jgi:hypothetical protein
MFRTLNEYNENFILPRSWKSFFNIQNLFEKFES